MDLGSSSPLIGDLIPNRVQELVEEQKRLADLVSPVEKWFGSDMAEAYRKITESSDIALKFQREIESSKRWASALSIVQSELPKRGWYLTGQEPCTLTPEIADLISKQKWEKVDQILMEHALDSGLDVEALAKWLRQQDVPECCIQRVQLFLDAWKDGKHDTAVLIGIPTIDELSRALFQGRDFMTKRSSKQPKPQMACATQAGTPLNSYSRGFVESFGLIHRDFKPELAADGNYFNRHAILHGAMRRSYGPKDSAKTFMLLMFVVFAADDEGNEDNETEDEVSR